MYHIFVPNAVNVVAVRFVAAHNRAPVLPLGGVDATLVQAQISCGVDENWLFENLNGWKGSYFWC